MAAGGEVAFNPKGREVGFARKILLNEAGAKHPMFKGKAPVFDAPCIHYDEVIRLPESATLLAVGAALATIGATLSRRIGDKCATELSVAHNDCALDRRLGQRTAHMMSC